MEVSSQLHMTASLPPVKILYYLFIGGWVGPRAGMEAVEYRTICVNSRDSSHEYSVVQPLFQSLYSLSYPGSFVHVCINYILVPKYLHEEARLCQLMIYHLSL
jgi:hypothetical protein